jgi:MoaA/NifB/PqqE/SkfB family radical SAM enzyme
MKEKSLESIDYWYNLIIGNHFLPEKELIQRMINSLKKEYPFLCSFILERSCNLNCLHCFFQKENSSEKISQSINLEKRIINIISQLPLNSSIIHEGRTLKGWHIPILNKVKEKREDISVGLIDNGSFVLQKEALEKNNLLFDWIDISVDGLKKEHNLQRQNEKAFDMAIKGLKEAKKYIQKNGKITSLFTATKINYGSLAETFIYLTDKKLINELHVTPASKVFSRNNNIAMDHNNWKLFWEQFKKAKLIGEKNNVNIYLKIYKLEDLISLSKVVGKTEIIKSFSDQENVLVGRGNISFIIDGIRVLYIPMSICPSETFIIDADAKYRLPYCIEYTLKELNQGKSNKRKDVSHYTVSEIKENSSFKALYQEGVEKWIKNFGLKILEEEIFFFKNKT